MGCCTGDAARGGSRDGTVSLPPTRRRSAIHSTTPPSADYLDDLHAFDPATMTWTLLSAALDAPRPSARYSHGFTSEGGKLYVHGGICITADGYGDCCSLFLSLLPTRRVPVPTPCLPSPFASPAPPESAPARPRLCPASATAGASPVSRPLARASPP